MKIANALPKDIVRNIGADIDEALAANSSKYNVKVRHSRIVQSETGFTTSLIGAARKTTQEGAEQRRAKIRHSFQYMFKHSEMGAKNPTLLGARIELSGKAFKIVGLTSTRPDARVVVKKGTVIRKLSQKQLEMK